MSIPSLIFVVIGTGKDQDMILAGPFTSHADASEWRAYYRWGSEVRVYKLEELEEFEA